MAKQVEELQVYQKSLAAAYAISAILRRPEFERYRELRSQLERGSIRVVSNIAEGFEQKTDRHFAKYLYDSRGGAKEICTQVALATTKQCVTEKQHEDLIRRYTEIGKMLTGLINYLNQEDWKHRR